MKKIIIDTEKTKLKIITFEEKDIHNYCVETCSYAHKKTNMYKGKIINIKHNVEAAFIDYGAQKCGFLPLNEVIQKKTICVDTTYANDIIVQLLKEEKDNKGATLTCNVSLLGYYLILLPVNKNKIGISKKILEPQRENLRNIIKNLNIPNEMGVIVRTTTRLVTTTDLVLDLELLLNQWETIIKNSKLKKSPYLLYQESNKIIQIIRDNTKTDIDTIIINNKKIYKLSYHYIKNIHIDLINKIKLHTSNNNIIKKFKLCDQIKSSVGKIVTLPTGGLIVIEKTEALISIDVNSAKNITKSNADETALKVNLEATDEIARQLKIRNLCGLIVIDYIDMLSDVNKEIVEKRMLKSIAYDTAKIKIGKISNFGLLVLSRQQIGKQKIKKYHTQKNKVTDSLLETLYEQIKYVKSNTIKLKLSFYRSHVHIKILRNCMKTIEINTKNQIIYIPMKLHANKVIYNIPVVFIGIQKLYIKCIV